MADFQVPQTTPNLWSTSDLSVALGQQLAIPIQANSVSIDTRTMQPGAIFVAIAGQNMDGGKFAQAALDKGAALCILQNAADIPVGQQDRCIIVPDSLKALEKMGRYARARFKGKLIGVTGSVGKTSSKEMLRLILEAQGPTYANYSSFNNHYGVPLTLANTPADAEYAVQEMGMNHAGELRVLSKLARPHVALVTTVAPAHLAFFSSVAGIAAAKAEIFEGLEPGGRAIIDFDNPYHQILAQGAGRHGAEVIGFSQHNKSAFMLLDSKFANGLTTVTISCHEKLYSYQLQAVGPHWVKLSLAVLAVVWALDGDLDAASYQMQNFTPPAGRGMLKTAKSGALIMDDSYNANPASMTASIATLAMHKKPGTRLVAILGDMADPGKQGPQMHADLAEHILQHKIDAVYTVGELMHNLYEALPATIRVRHTATPAELAASIASELGPNDIVSVKGANFLKMVQIVNALVG